MRGSISNINNLSFYSRMAKEDRHSEINLILCALAAFAHFAVTQHQKILPSIRHDTHEHEHSVSIDQSSYFSHEMIFLMVKTGKNARITP